MSHKNVIRAWKDMKYRLRLTETERMQLESNRPEQWLEGLQSYTRRWVEEHQGGGADTWTVVANSDAA